MCSKKAVVQNSRGMEIICHAKIKQQRPPFLVSLPSRGVLSFYGAVRPLYGTTLSLYRTALQMGQGT